MAVYEYFYKAPDSQGVVRGQYAKAQSFTIGTVGPNTTHDVASVNLKFYRLGSPGTIYISIRNVDETGKPSGSDLCTGSFNGNDLTTDLEGEWLKVDLSPAYTLTASSKYAIVALNNNTSSGNSGMWKTNINTNDYDNRFGRAHYSVDTGNTWSNDIGDYMFDERDANATIFNIAKTETANLSDSFSCVSTTKNLLVSDILSLTDIFSNFKIANTSFTETANLSDVFSKNANFPKQFSESASLSDIFSRRAILNVSKAEGISLLDGISLQVTFIQGIELEETVSLSDSVSTEVIPYVPQTYSLHTTETLIVTDNLNRSFIFQRQISDALNLTDDVNLNFNFQRAVADTLSISDGISVHAIKTWGINLTDNFTLADTISYCLGNIYSIALEDSFSYIDIFTQSLKILSRKTWQPFGGQYAKTKMHRTFGGAR